MQKPPDEKHWFGTDQIGRDTLSRVIYGSRASLTVAFGAVLFGTTVGALWGLACGYFGGRFDMASQRLIEFLQSFPDLILAMAIAMALGGGLGTVIVAIAITRIPFGGRVIRSVVLSLKEIQYVEAARGLGASHKRLMFRHILPQCVAPYLILATTHLGVAIVVADLGQHAVRRPQCRPGAAVVAGAVSRRGYHHHGARLQPFRRRHPRPARSAVEGVGLGQASTASHGLQRKNAVIPSEARDPWSTSRKVPRCARDDTEREATGAPSYEAARSGNVTPPSCRWHDAQ